MLVRRGKNKKKKKKKNDFKFGTVNCRFPSDGKHDDNDDDEVMLNVLGCRLTH